MLPLRCLLRNLFTSSTVFLYVSSVHYMWILQENFASISMQQFWSLVVMFVLQNLDSHQPKPYFRSTARLPSCGSSVNLILHSTHSLLEDYYLMSKCRNSLYCSQVHCPPTVVTCINCGKHFIGIGDRVLKLSNHIKSEHRLEADILLLDMIRRFSRLLEQMQKFLHMDQCFIASHFD